MRDADAALHATLSPVRRQAAVRLVLSDALLPRDERIKAIGLIQNKASLADVLLAIDEEDFDMRRDVIRSYF